jgi:ABC-type amino acid transport substrate-binding protein
MPLDLIIRKDLETTSPAAVWANPQVVFGRITALSYGKWGNAYLESLPKGRVDDTPTIDALFRKLAIGRIGATFGYSLMYQRNLDINHLAKDVSIIQVNEAQRTVLGLAVVHKQVAPPDVTTLSNAAIAMREDGTLARLLARYLGDAVAADIVWRAARDPLPQ